MGLLPQLPRVVNTQEQNIIEFKGYSNNPIIEDGEMREMVNLSSDQYPYLSQRQPRGIYQQNEMSAVEGDQEEDENALNSRNDITNIYAWKEKLVVVAGQDLYYDGVRVNADMPLTAGDKIIVGINNKLCIFPDRVCYDLAVNDPSQRMKLMYASLELYNVNDVVFSHSTITFPEDEREIPGAYVGELVTGDAVTILLQIDGQECTVSGVIKSFDGVHLVMPENTFVNEIIGLTQYGASSSEEPTVTHVVEHVLIQRSCPQFDFVIEQQNRLWGTLNNRIYSCKLGDPTNWEYFQGMDSDSYQVDVGSDGDFTGIAAFPSHIVFFKEQCMHKLYGSNKPSSYQLITMDCNGMESGSFKSAVTMDGVLYYKSKLGIMAYTGDYPVHITSSFRQQYKNAVAGTDKQKYYISMQAVTNDDSEGEWEMFAYDFGKKLWHREDNTHALQFANLCGRLLYINSEDDETDIYYAVAQSGDDIPASDEHMYWRAVFGDFDERLENKKIYSKLQMRFTMEPEADLTIWLATDGGDYEEVTHLKNDTERSVYLPIVPRRCQRFRLLLEGHGRTRVESLVRVAREGSGV